MTTKKGKITDRNNFAIEPLFPRYVGYADYFLATPVSVQVRNDSSEAVTLQVSVESESGLLVPYETQAEVPFESSVELTAEGIFSPLLLAENDEVRVCPVTVTARLDGKPVASAAAEITALPFDWWEGLDGNAERLAAFVRPRLADCAALTKD